MVIDHIGIVVSSIEEGIRRWEQMFDYRQISPIVHNSRQKVRVTFLVKEGSVMIKLVEPSDPTSPVWTVARKGGGLHHLCFRCESIDSSIRTLKEVDARVIVPPEPGEAFRNHEIAFLLVPGNLNCELIDTAEKVLLSTPSATIGSNHI